MEDALFEPGFNMRSRRAYDHLSTKAKVLNRVLCNRVYSKINSRRVVREWLALVYGILNPTMMINLGFHVVKGLMEFCASKKKVESLPYPRLITLFCLKAKVKGSTVETNWVFSRNQFARTKGFDAPKGRVPKASKPRRALLVEEGNEEDSETTRTDSLGTSAQKESMVRMEAYFERQDAMFSRMEKFMESQARFMEQVGEALGIGPAIKGSGSNTTDGEFDQGGS